MFSAVYIYYDTFGNSVDRWLSVSQLYNVLNAVFFATLFTSRDKIVVTFVVQPKPVRNLTVISHGIHPPVVSFGTPKTRKSICYSILVNCNGSNYSVRTFFKFCFKSVCLNCGMCRVGMEP